MKAKHIAIWPLLFLLSSCSVLGILPADTFNKRLIVGYTMTTSLRTTAENLLIADKITPDDAESVNAEVDMARQGIDVARAVGKLDVKEGDQRLTAIITSLKVLESVLEGMK